MSINAGQPGMPLHLLTLPGEIRNRIYRLVLTPEKLCYPHRYHSHNCGCPNRNLLPPQVQLLRVNKQIKEEASTLLYAESTFCLITGYDAMIFMADIDHYCSNHIPTPGNLFPSRHLIRKISLCVMPERLTLHLQAQQVQDFWADPDFRALSKRRRNELLHARECYRTNEIWQDLGRILAHLEALEVLTLDVEQAFCSYGCCRLTRSVIVGFRDTYLVKTAKARRFSIKIKNALDNAEKNTLMHGLVSHDWSEDDIGSSEYEDDGSDDEDTTESDDEGDDDDNDHPDSNEGGGDGNSRHSDENDQNGEGKNKTALAKSTDRSKLQSKRDIGAFN